MLVKNLPRYTKEQIDTDGSIYLVKCSDVYCYKWHDSDLNAIFKRFQDRFDHGLYIIGNYLYFTLNGAKYWVSLCTFSGEWEGINTLVDEISKKVDFIAYEKGRLD